ncbi:hypothetical protein ACBP93_11240 [Paenalcaligenes hominis]|uniref:PD-(D/E)XK nuclease family protein n=1 Tax=Paenalcaligenes hominis TaxID=643674 RepID=UPI003523802D
MYAQLDCTELLQLQSEETLVLTVNNRFARRILSDLQQSLRGQKKAIAVPDIMPLSAWLRQANDDLSFFDDYVPASYLLDSFSSLNVWEQIIYNQEEEKAWLIDVAQAAKLADDADLLMDEWSLAIEPQEHTADSQRFAVWREAYKQYLEEHDLDDQNRAAERVVVAIEQAWYQPPWKNVVLVGFHDMSQRMSRLIRGLQHQGVKLYTFCDEVRPPAQAQRVLAPTPEAEWRLAAQWAAQQLRDNPQGCYAIVAFDLQKQVPHVHRVLAHELAPQSDLCPGFKWNVAVGRPLSQWPLVRAALAWLRVLAQYQQGRVRCQTLGQALLQGYCKGDRSERHLRVQLDVKWRQQQTVFLNSADVDIALAQFEQLGPAWQEAVQCIQHQDARLAPALWITPIRAALQALGFPGEQTLDSHAYQTMQTFEQRLGLFSRLAPVFGAPSFAQVVAMLERYLHETLFQPQRETGTRLDILGPLEAEGGHWDGIWVIGTTDEVLPAIPKPNPFIPYQVLRQAQAPRSTPERELQWAYQLCEVLHQAAPTLIFSHAEQDNGQLLRPSPLIESLPVKAELDPLAQPVEHPPALERLLDEQGPPLEPGHTIFGGSGVLDKQARNPLWAFVQYRLHTQALPSYEDTRAIRLWRGNFLHRALELVWLSIEPKDSTGLEQAFIQQTISTWIQLAVEQAALEELAKMPLVIRQLEIERALGVLTTWFELERTRSPFCVRALEQEHALPDFNTRMRIDRIDELNDGRLVLMDYKASVAHKRYVAWLRERPIELQLPIYAALLTQQDKTVAALGFGFLHYEAVLGGFSHDPELLTQTDQKKFDECFSSWAEFEQHLIEHVWAMRDEFLQGMARNQYYALDDLMYCDVVPFLRLNQEVWDELDEAE